MPRKHNKKNAQKEHKENHEVEHLDNENQKQEEENEDLDHTEENKEINTEQKDEKVDKQENKDKNQTIKEESNNNNVNNIQDEEKFSDTSNDSDDIYEEFFSGVRQENAKRIMTQIAELPYIANDYLKMLIIIAKNFDKMRKNLDNPYNSFFSSIFSFLKL